MADEPDSMILMFLRRLDVKIDKVAEDVREVKHRLTALEIAVANLAATAASHYASLATRLDRAESRLERIERRLDLVEVTA